MLKLRHAVSQCNDSDDSSLINHILSFPFLNIKPVIFITIMAINILGLLVLGTHDASAAVPAAPVLNTATGGSASVTLAWNVSPDATSYKVYYGTVSGTYTSYKAVGNVASYTITGLSAGKMYYVAVAGVSSSGEGLKSNELSALTIPGVPSITLAGGKNQVTVKWAAITSATSYKVYYGTTPAVYGTPLDVGNVTTTAVRGLNASTVYYFAVSASNTTDQGAKSVEKSVTTFPDAPPAPVMTGATGSAGSVTLNWNALAEATSYKLYYGTTSGTYTGSKSLGNVSTYSLSGLAAGTTYYFALAGINAGGEGLKSNELSALTIPAAPSIRLSGGKNQVVVKWGAIASATSYTIYYGTATGVYGVPAPAGNVTTYTLPGLNASTAYYVTVSATNATGEGAKSAEKSVTTFPDSPPAPVMTGATGATGSVTLNWNALPEATSYKLYYGTTSGTYTGSKSLGNVSTYSLAGLAAGTTYYFALAGINAGGEGAKSGELSALTIPAAPSLSLTTGKNQLTVKWNAVVSATSYTVYYGTATGVYGVPVNAGNVTTYAMANLNALTVYYVAVSATNAAGEGAKSAEKNVATLPDPPAAPVMNAVTGGTASATLSWNTLPEATSYKLYYGTVTGTYTGYKNVGNVATTTLTGLSAGRTYYFALAGVNAGGEGVKSKEWTALTAPGSPSISLTGGKNQIIVRWGAVPSATSYTLYDGTASGVYGTPVNAGNGTTYTLTGLNASTTYYFALSASNTTDQGPKSAEKNVVTLPDAPSAPVMTSAAGGVTSASLNWNALAEATSYKLYYGTVAGTYTGYKSVGNVTTYTITGLAAGKTYYFALAGMNAGGEGAKSNELSVLTMAGAPSITLTPAKKQVTVKWSAVASATSYTIYYGTASGVYGTPVSAGNVTNYAITGLNDSTTYFVVVSASNASGEGPRSVEKSTVTPLPDLPVPPALNTMTGGSKQITLAWTAVTGATSYKVYYGTTAGTYGTPIDVGDVTTYTVTGLSSVSTYYAVVTAINAKGESAKSNEKNATTLPDAPEAPVLNAMTGAAQQVALGWSSVSGATAYRVYYGTATGIYGAPIDVGNVTSYTLSGLANGLTCYAVVTAVNGGGESGKSNEKSATTLPAIPDVPVLSAATGGIRQVSLEWTSVASASSYKVYYGTAPGVVGSPVDVGNTTSFTLTGLADAVTYYCTVTAVNPGGESGKSNEKSALTLPLVPATPALSTLAGGNGQLTLTWGAINGALTYRVYYGTSTGVYGAPIDTAGATTYTITGLENNTTYYAVVTSVNASAESQKSNEMSATTTAVTTSVGGVLTTNTTWTKNNSPYIVTDNVIVNPNVTLTIQPGVVVKFNGNYFIDGQGIILAQGTAQAPILFTSNRQTPAARDWQYIAVKTKESIIDHVKVEYSVQGVFVPSYSTNPALVQNSVFSNNYYGISFGSGTSPNILSNTITNNVRGIFAECNGWTGCAPVINNNSILNNTEYSISTESYGTDASSVRINARNNWWGTVDTTAIDTSIRDQKDAASLALVDYSPFLDGPGGNPVLTPLTLKTAVPDIQKVTLSWIQNSAAMSYKVKYGTSSSNYSSTLDAGVDGVYSVPGLTNGTRYYFVVVAIINGLETPLSNELTAVPGASFQGPITQSTTWTKANSPYAVTGDITVNSGVTLTIEPGAVVQFYGDFKLTVLGKLMAQGTPGDFIHFTSSKTSPGSGDWNRIEFLAAADASSQIAYAEVAYAKNGVSIDGVSITVANNNIHHNAAYGIMEHRASAVVTANTINNNNVGLFIQGISTSPVTKNSITNNALSGVQVDFEIGSTPNPLINNNSIYGNGTFNLSTTLGGISHDESGNVVNAKQNWWGLDTEAGIRATIYDKRNQGYCPSVNIIPFLLAPIDKLISFSAVSATPQFFDPHQTATSIQYTLDKGADVVMKVYNFDVNAFAPSNLVRTISSAGRLVGVNTEVWDGKDNAGNLLPSGVYAYVIDAADSTGQKGRYDVSDFVSTSAVISNTSFLPSGDFSPFKGDRLEIHYDLDAPALVSLGYMNTIEFLTRQPRKLTGNVDYWNGYDNAGAIASNNVGIGDIVGKAEKLPANIVVLENHPAVDVTSLAADPCLIHPLYGEITTIVYTLSAAANVTVQILLPDGGLALRTLENNVSKSAGTYNVTWDGKTSSGITIAEDGDYRVHVEAVDYSGQTVTRDGVVRVRK